VVVAQLVVGPAFAGSRLLWHDHGEDGGHAHMLSGLAVSDHHDLHHDLHDDGHDQHQGGADDGRHGEHEHAHVPHGLVVKLPTLSILSSSSVRVADAVAQMLAWDVCRLAVHAVVPSAASMGGDREPLQREHGSGAARILRKNHALLI
jgi:hypothetical protein